VIRKLNAAQMGGVEQFTNDLKDRERELLAAALSELLQRPSWPSADPKGSRPPGVPAHQGLPHVAPGVRSAIANGLGAGVTPAGGALGHVTSVVREAFVSALGTGLTIGAAVTLVGATVAFLLVKHGASQAPADDQARADSEPGILPEAAEAELALV
jgi:hypothetical protein